METIGGGEPMVWLTSLDDICCEGSLESYSIFLLDSRNMGQSFAAVVGFTIVIHTVWRPNCVWASATTVASAWCAAKLTVLSGPLVESPLVSFLWRWPNFFPNHLAVHNHRN
jgi:hypothetical protein